MTRFFKRAAGFVQMALGLDRVGANFKRFATMHWTYSVFQAMVSSYIITLLMRVTGDGDIVIWYNLFNFIFHGCGVILGVYVMRKGSVNLAVRAAIMGFIILYTTLLFTMVSADKFMIVFGLLNGVSNGFYWLAYAAYFAAFTEDNSRDAALGFMGFINGITVLIMPVLSGFLIETIGKAAGTFTGYIAVFAVSFLVATVSIILSFRLPKKAEEEPIRKTRFAEAFRTIAHDSCWRCGMACESLRGIRDGTLNFLLNLLLFEIIQSETLIGFNSLLASIGTILSFWIAGKVIKPHNRVRSIFIGSSVLVSACALIAFRLNPVTIMIFAVFNSFFSTFVINPSNGIMFLIVQKKAQPGMASEYFSIRDLFLCIGRAISVSILLLFPRVQIGYVIAITVLTSTQFAVAFLSKRSTRLLREMDEPREIPETAGDR